MKMEYVTPERLLEVLNEKLYELEACPDWKFRRPPHGPKKPDANGCNWSDIVDIEGPCRECGPEPVPVSWTSGRRNQAAMRVSCSRTSAGVLWPCRSMSQPRL